MSRIVQWTAVVVGIALLLGILLALIDIGRDGIHLDVGGTIEVVGMPESVALSLDDPVTLTMGEPAQLVTSGPDGGAIPAALSLLPCSACGAPMLPVRWNPWSGEIEWSCPACGETVTASPSG